MKALYCHDNIYQQCPDGVVYSPGQFPYEYFTTFLQNFAHVTVAGRGIHLKDPIVKMNVSSGPHVSFALFPNINTPLGRIKFYESVNRRMEEIIAECDAVIIRAVSDLGWIAFQKARKLNKPIAMEMAACAWDSTWNHGSKLGKIYAPFRFYRGRSIAAHSDYVIYVSQDFLQSRYPTNGQTSHASNVRIEKADYAMIEKRLVAIRQKDDLALRPNKIGLIGNLNNKIKGVADTIHALSMVEREKPGCFEFHHLGPGNPEPYKAFARKLGVADHIHFDGMIQSGEGVLKWLKHLDLYLQPSYQEGVPRATIEAMSMACPVIASTAGGIPELIEQKWLIKPGDVKSLKNKIVEMLDSPQKQYESGLENFNRSLDYTKDKLEPRRAEFWREFANYARDRRSILE